ncbi:MAG: cyclic nucleotide-binding domain-containing protein [Thermodesulfobacteriota bacterium]
MKNNLPTHIGKLQERIIEFLIKIPLFDRLDATELQLIAHHMNFFEIQKNAVLFNEGDKGDYVCFIVDGQLDVIKESASGQPVVIATLSKGRTIGEMSIIDNTPRSATIKAKSDATLVSLTGKGLESILQNQPQIGIKILKGLARLLSMNMRKTSSQLADNM